MKALGSVSLRRRRANEGTDKLWDREGRLCALAVTAAVDDEEIERPGGVRASPMMATLGEDTRRLAARNDRRRTRASS